MNHADSCHNITHWRVLWSNARLLYVAIFFSFVVTVLSLTIPFFMLLIYDRVLNARSLETLSTLVILAVLLLIAMGAIDYSRRRLLARFGGQLQERLEDHPLALPPQSTTAGVSKDLGVGDLDRLRGFMHSGAPLNIIDVAWVPLFVGAVFLRNSFLGWIAVIGILVLIAVHAVGRVLASHRRREARESLPDVRSHEPRGSFVERTVFRYGRP